MCEVTSTPSTITIKKTMNNDSGERYCWDHFWTNFMNHINSRSISTILSYRHSWSAHHCLQIIVVRHIVVVVIVFWCARPFMLVCSCSSLNCHRRLTPKTFHVAAVVQHKTCKLYCIKLVELPFNNKQRQKGQHFGQSPKGCIFHLATRCCLPHVQGHCHLSKSSTLKHTK